MNRFCRLCSGTFNFGKLQITESYDGATIYLSSHINKLKEDEKFKFCPLCGEKLSPENFQGVKNRLCLNCANSFLRESPDGEKLHCSIKDNTIVHEGGCCKDWS